MPVLEESARSENCRAARHVRKQSVRHGKARPVHASPTTRAELAHFYDFNYHAGTGLGTFRKTGMSVQESYLIRWENIEEGREERRAADFKTRSRAENEEAGEGVY